MVVKRCSALIDSWFSINISTLYHGINFSLRCTFPTQLLSFVVFINLFFCVIDECSGQQDLKKIIPPSPTVASLGSYGDTPVGYYAGTPSISIPIHEIKVGDLSLPISLSYNAKGVKVEEIATWTGLGWSLNAGGIITRSVRGTPDEYGNGYASATVTKVSDMVGLWPTYNWTDEFNPNYLWPTPFTDAMRSIANGTIDAEADVFYFNFGKYSGKFYYHQNSGKFINAPQNNIFFDKAYFDANQKWHLITEDGVEYFFDLIEHNLTYSQCNGSASAPENIATGWFLTKIYSPSTGRQIDFSYDAVSYATKNIASYTLNTSQMGGSFLDCAQQYKLCYSINNYSGYRLSSISYDGGHVDFSALLNRCDLPGDKSLDAVKIFKEGETLPFRKYEFGYSYFNNNLVPQGTCNEETSFLVRLKLQSIKTVGSDGQELPPYSFEYNESFSIPSRMSYSQDAWGYFNNASNSHLVPPYIKTFGNLYLAGANRTVDTTYSLVGSLKKIIYPTGGFTEYSMENNKVANYIKYSSNQYLKNRMEILDMTDDCDSNPSTPVFCKTVVINDQRGTGAYVNIRVNNMYCWDCSLQPMPAPTSCGVMALGGMQIVCGTGTDKIYVPNGTYNLTADFSGSSLASNYEEFSIQLFWEEYNPPAGVHEASIGGLRVKTITDHDGHGNTMLKEYEYAGGTVSENKFFFEYNMGCISDPVVTFIVRPSYSSIPLGAASASSFGYATVTEKRMNNMLPNGKSVYYYTSAVQFPDIANASYPYGDPISFEHRRGLLLKKEDYAWRNNTYALVRSVENQYKPLNTVYDWPELGFTNPDTLYTEILNIRAAYIDIWAIPNGAPYAYPILYKTISEWIRPVKTTEKQFDEFGNFVEVVTDTKFENPAHQLPTTISVTRNNSGRQITKYRYPHDYTPGTSTANGIKWLRDKHYITSLIEKIVTRKDNLGAEKVIDGLVLSYDGKQLPYEAFSLQTSDPIPVGSFTNSGFSGGNFQKDSRYKRSVSFTYDYAAKSNLVGQQKESDVVVSYIWGYNETNPIAEIKNASSVSVYHTSFEETGVVGAAVTGKKYYSGSIFTIPVVDQPIGSNLKMTYWYYDGSWKFKSAINYSSTISEPGASRYDEIRVHPSGAQMTTYTYDPGVGITSVNDANNLISYYEYDTFGRLKNIRDANNKVLKSYTYHFKTN